MTGTNNWDEYRIYVVDSLKHIHHVVSDQEVRIRSLEVKQAVLTVKMALWGAIGAAIPTAVAVAAVILKGH